MRAEYPADWEAILAAGNERPPLTLRVNVRGDHARGVPRRMRRAPASARSPPARPASSSTRRGRCPSCRDTREGWFSRAGPGRATRRAAARGRSRDARARRLRGARRQDDAPAPSSPTSSSSRSTATPRGSRACARTSRACSSTAERVERGRRRRRRARRRGGTAARSTASWSTRRARRRASCAAIRTASGCAAPGDVAALRAAAGAASSTRCGRASRAAGCCSTRPARCFATKTRPQIEAFRARHADALREPLTFPAEVAASRGPTLAFAPGRSAQSGRVFLRAPPQGLNRRDAGGRAGRASAVPAAPFARTPPRVLRAVCRHAA